MRPSIRFRIWDKQFSKYWDLSNGLALNLYGSFTLAFNTKQGLYPIPDTGQKDLGLDRYILEQFTGLKDRNGTPIFEGDICRFDLEGITHGPERETNIVEPVRWCEENACWALGHHTQRIEPPAGAPETVAAYDFEWWYTFQDRIDRKTLEVIGNVHQNPELLK